MVEQVTNGILYSRSRGEAIVAGGRNRVRVEIFRRQIAALARGRAGQAAAPTKAARAPSGRCRVRVNFAAPSVLPRSRAAGRRQAPPRQTRQPQR